MDRVVSADFHIVLWPFVRFDLMLITDDAGRLHEFVQANRVPVAVACLFYVCAKSIVFRLNYHRTLRMVRGKMPEYKISGFHKCRHAHTRDDSNFVIRQLMERYPKMRAFAARHTSRRRLIESMRL